MLIDGQKWACEACIRGHRVTSCKHHDRPLTRINRKGRPFSTCAFCNSTPCKVPEAHNKLRREAESKAPSHSSKKATTTTSRHGRPCSGFLPIAPRPPTAPVTLQYAGRNENEILQKRSLNSSHPGSMSASEAIPFSFANSVPAPVDECHLTGSVPQSSALSESFPSASSLSDMSLPLSMSMPTVTTNSLDGHGFQAFYTDPTPLESAGEFCAPNELVAPDLPDDWCSSSHLWATGDPL